jgi:hypothetical protein
MPANAIDKVKKMLSQFALIRRGDKIQQFYQNALDFSKTGEPIIDD